MADQKAKVKMRVDQVSKFAYGEVIGLKHVGPVPVMKGKKPHENIKYASEMSSATFEMQVELDAPFYGMFEPGQEYYV